MKKSFLFVGGDLRSLYAAQKLSSLYNVYVYGFDETEAEIDVQILKEQPAERYDYIVLPLPSSTDGKTINAPYAKKEILFEQIIPLAKNTVFCGRTSPEIETLCKSYNVNLYDYFTREELTVRNALITAEGAIEIIMHESATTIFGSKILITGFGRISKILLKQLSALGADVSITARKCDQLAWAEIMGAKPLCICDMEKTLGNFDMIINTVPYPLFKNDMLNIFKKDCLFIDLASKSGLESVETAKEKGIKIIWALSLPGKTAPITAGEIIADSILNILTENAPESTEGGICCDS